MSSLLRTLAALLALAAPLHAPADGLDRGGLLRELLRERPAEGTGAAAETDPGVRLTRPGDYAFTLQHDGLTRRLRVHVPRSYDGRTPVPLLLSFHGGGANMDHQAADERYGQIAASEKHGFVVAFPNGYSRLPGGRLATWNAGGCCGPAKDRQVDDVGFARRIVEQLRRQLEIDPQRVFATGFSNGAMLTHRLACEAGDVFRAIAAVAGTDNTLGCTPKRPVSVLVVHARNDDHNRFDGGAGERSVDRGNMAGATSVPETVERWRVRNACPRTPAQPVLERPGARCERHAPCQDGTEVVLCVTERGAHSWPGARVYRSSEPPSTAVDANELMWAFFLGRPLDGGALSPR
jgi:polyhydroxybutyrate depolymerase